MIIYKLPQTAPIQQQPSLQQQQSFYQQPSIQQPQPSIQQPILQQQGFQQSNIQQQPSLPQMPQQQQQYYPPQTYSGYPENPPQVLRTTPRPNQTAPTVNDMTSLQKGFADMSTNPLLVPSMMQPTPPIPYASQPGVYSADLGKDFNMQQYPPQGYNQQSYPQQGAYSQYPQQSGYPQQEGYPQQTGYPQQVVYSQQAGYSQYPQQAAPSGYPVYGQPGYPTQSYAQPNVPILSIHIFTNYR